MKYHTMLTQDGRVVVTSAAHLEGEGMIQIEFPEDFDFTHQSDWRLVDGALVYDPLPEAEPVPTLMEVLQAQVNELLLAVADMIGGALG